MVQRKYVQRGHAQPGFNYLGSRYMREREREVAGEGVRGVVVVFGARACLRTYRRLRIVVLLQITEQLKFPTLWMRFPTFLVGNLFQRVGNLFVVPL
jgi:hypothetical protein